MHAHILECRGLSLPLSLDPTYSHSYKLSPCMLWVCAWVRTVVFTGRRSLKIICLVVNVCEHVLACMQLYSYISEGPDLCHDKH